MPDMSLSAMRAVVKVTSATRSCARGRFCLSVSMKHQWNGRCAIVRLTAAASAHDVVARKLTRIWVDDAVVRGKGLAAFA